MFNVLFSLSFGMITLQSEILKIFRFYKYDNSFATLKEQQ